jgi:hypothetical protein
LDELGNGGSDSLVVALDGRRKKSEESVYFRPFEHRVVSELSMGMYWLFLQFG